MFGQDFDVKVWSKDFEFWNLIKICVRTCFFGKQNSTLGSVVPLAMFITIYSKTESPKRSQRLRLTGLKNPSKTFKIGEVPFLET